VSDNSLPALLIYGYGLVFGLVTASSLALLWLILGGSIREAFLEAFIDPIVRKKTGPSQGFVLSNNPAAALADPRTCSVIISDLHCDFWDHFDNDQARKFQDFCNAIQRNPQISQIFLNGDLADFPQQGETIPVLTVRLLQQTEPELPTPSGQSIDKTLHILYSLSHLESRHIAVNFILGNHDCGLSGLRTAAGNSFVRQLFQRVWQPAMQVGDPGSPSIYLEHGHRYDPFLLLYTRFAVLDLIRLGRKDRDLDFIDQQLKSTNADRARNSSAGAESHAYAWILRMGYRFSARRVLTKRPGTAQYGSVVFGHTHLPDRYTFPGGSTYFNSGDWSALSGHANFLLVTTDGHLHGPYEWPTPA